MRIFTHPKNIEYLRSILPHAQGPLAVPVFISGHQLGDIELHADPYLPETTRTPTGKILWPEDRFVEYEESDLAWALPLGIAEREYLEERVFYQIGEQVLFHKSATI